VAVFLESLWKNGVAHDIILNIFDCEFPDWNSSEAFYPIRDGELFGCDILCHREPPIHVRQKNRRQSNPAEAGIAEEL